MPRKKATTRSHRFRFRSWLVLSCCALLLLWLWDIIFCFCFGRIIIDSAHYYIILNLCALSHSRIHPCCYWCVNHWLVHSDIFHADRRRRTGPQLFLQVVHTMMLQCWDLILQAQAPSNQWHCLEELKKINFFKTNLKSYPPYRIWELVELKSHSKLSYV